MSKKRNVGVRKSVTARDQGSSGILQGIAKSTQTLGQEVVITTKNDTILTYNEESGVSVRSIGNCERMADIFYGFDRSRAPLDIKRFPPLGLHRG